MAQDGKITVDPSLGPRGYIQDEMQVGVQMFARYYIAHHSQDLHYEGSIASLNKDIQEAGGDIDELVNIVRNSLSRYYLDAFKTANINVSIKHLSDSEARVTLVISIKSAAGREPSSKSKVA